MWLLKEAIKGYVDGNVQWVHKDVNFMKSDLEQSRFIDLCAKIVRRRDLQLIAS